MSVQSSSQTMAAPRVEHPSFPVPLAETLLHTEDQMHAHMDKARSAFERMSKKAQEAQAAKDKEIAELRKALALSEERAKAQEIAFQEKESALTEKNKTLSDANASLKAQVAKAEGTLEKVKDAFADMRKEPQAASLASSIERYPNGWWYNIERITWDSSSRAVFPIPGMMIRLCKKIQFLGL